MSEVSKHLLGAPDSDGDERQTTPPTQIPVNVGAPPEYYPQHTAPVYQPHLPQYYPSGQQQSNTTVVVAQQPGVTYVQAPSRPNDYLGLSIFACLCCFWPTALVALIYSCQVNDRYAAGDFAGAEDSSQKARTWAKISIIVGVVAVAVIVGINVISVIGVVVSAGASAASASDDNNNY